LTFIILFRNIPDHDFTVFSTRSNNIIIERVEISIENGTGVTSIKRIIIG
jgi:hypothetical protein